VNIPVSGKASNHKSPEWLPSSQAYIKSCQQHQQTAWRCNSWTPNHFDTSYKLN